MSVSQNISSFSFDWGCRCCHTDIMCNGADEAPQSAYQRRAIIMIVVLTLILSITKMPLRRRKLNSAKTTNIGTSTSLQGLALHEKSTNKHYHRGRTHHGIVALIIYALTTQLVEKTTVTMIFHGFQLCPRTVRLPGHRRLSLKLHISIPIISAQCLLEPRQNIHCSALLHDRSNSDPRATYLPCNTRIISWWPKIAFHRAGSFAKSAACQTV